MLWQTANHAQRQSLRGTVVPGSRRPFGIDEHKATPGTGWRM
jgi:hypothetical protein